MPDKKRLIKFNKAINEAINLSMTKDKSVIAMALGIDDPKGIFETTINLSEKFGNKRVFDMPTAENSMTGIAIGVAINGYKPIITHQRVEFSLLSIEQIINQASKWSYMSAGKMHLPIVIRLIIGRGWGQGPQHSQSLENIFASIPGLKVICPSNAYDAKGLLISSIFDKNPVIFYEHRWLHNYSSFVPKKFYKLKLGKSNIIQKGKSISIISSSFMTTEVIKASKILKKYNIDAEILDLISLRPLDTATIIKTARKTKKILIVDNGWMKFGISSEIGTIITENLSENFKFKLKRIGLADSPIPSTRSLARYSYVSVEKIVNTVFLILNKNIKIKEKYNKNFDDTPDNSFSGPF